MRLKYFSLSDSPKELKTKYRRLAFQLHPDRNPEREKEATRIMQEIHAELEYCYGRAGVKYKDMDFNEFMDELLKKTTLSDENKILAKLGAAVLREVFKIRK